MGYIFIGNFISMNEQAPIKCTSKVVRVPVVILSSNVYLMQSRAFHSSAWNKFSISQKQSACYLSYLH